MPWRLESQMEKCQAIIKGVQELSLTVQTQKHVWRTQEEHQSVNWSQDYQSSLNVTLIAGFDYKMENKTPHKLSSGRLIQWRKTSGWHGKSKQSRWELQTSMGGE